VQQRDITGLRRRGDQKVGVLDRALERAAARAELLVIHRARANYASAIGQSGSAQPQA